MPTGRCGSRASSRRARSGSTTGRRCVTSSKKVATSRADAAAFAAWRLWTTLSSTSTSCCSPASPQRLLQRRERECHECNANGCGEGLLAEHRAGQGAGRGTPPRGGRRDLYLAELRQPGAQEDSSLDRHVQGTAALYRHGHARRRLLDDRGIQRHRALRCRRERGRLRLVQVSLGLAWEGGHFTVLDSREGARREDRLLPVHGRYVRVGPVVQQEREVDDQDGSQRTRVRGLALASDTIAPCGPPVGADSSSARSGWRSVWPSPRSTHCVRVTTCIPSSMRSAVPPSRRIAPAWSVSCKPAAG